VNDSEVNVNLEVNILRYHPEKMLMEEDFSGMVFTEFPSNRIPETAKRAIITGKFRVGVLAHPDFGENLLSHEEYNIQMELDKQ
jgi:hypothetical protein